MICRGCEIDKLESEFAPTYRTCKKCMSIRTRTHRLKNIESIRAKNREYYWTHGALQRKRITKLPEDEERRRDQASRKKWIEANREKNKSHHFVEFAIRTGRLKRESCVVCGSDNTHAHHDDYTKPLEVTWLCPLHHKQRHKQLRSDRKQ